MLCNRLFFITADITFVSVNLLSDTISSFSNMYIALDRVNKREVNENRPSTHKSFSDGKFVIVKSCNSVISPNV